MIDSKCKKCRRAGEKLFLKGDRCYTQKCAMVKRPYAPGQHGQKQKRKRAPSEFGVRLKEKQHLRSIYGLREVQFRKYFTLASRKKGVTGEELLKILESRLDNAVYRAGFAASRSIARQMVSHGHIDVNGRRVSIPSYSVKKNDMVAVRPNSGKKAIFKGLEVRLKKYEPPTWLSLDKEKMACKVLRAPAGEDAGFSGNLQWIVEYYSR